MSILSVLLSVWWGNTFPSVCFLHSFIISLFFVSSLFFVLKSIFSKFCLSLSFLTFGLYCSGSYIMYNILILLFTLQGIHFFIFNVNKVHRNHRRSFLSNHLCISKPLPISGIFTHATIRNYLLVKFLVENP